MKLSENFTDTMKSRLLWIVTPFAALFGSIYMMPARVMDVPNYMGTLLGSVTPFLVAILLPRKARTVFLAGLIALAILAFAVFDDYQFFLIGILLAPTSFFFGLGLGDIISRSNHWIFSALYLGLLGLLLYFLKKISPAARAFAYCVFIGSFLLIIRGCDATIDKVVFRDPYDGGLPPEEITAQAVEAKDPNKCLDIVYHPFMETGTTESKQRECIRQVLQSLQAGTNGEEL